MHRQVHAHKALGVQAQPVVLQTCADCGQVPSSSWMASLFPAHDDPGSCALFDQLSHGDSACLVALVPLPVMVPASFIQLIEGQALARWAALFEARGPPLSL